MTCVRRLKAPLYHETLQCDSTHTKSLIHYISHSIQLPPLHPHTRTPPRIQSCNPSLSLLPSLSPATQSVTQWPPIPHYWVTDSKNHHSHVTRRLSSKIKIKSSTVSSTCESVRIAQKMRWRVKSLRPYLFIVLSGRLKRILTCSFTSLSYHLSSRYCLSMGYIQSESLLHERSESAWEQRIALHKCYQ